MPVESLCGGTGSGIMRAGDLTQVGCGGQRIMQAGGLLCTSDMALFQLAKSAEVATPTSLSFGSLALAFRLQMCVPCTLVLTRPAHPAHKSTHAHMFRSACADALSGSFLSERKYSHRPFIEVYSSFPCRARCFRVFLDT